MKKRIPAFAAAILAALVSFVFAASCSGIPPAVGTSGAEPVPLSEDVRTGTLPNGLRYYIRENRKPEGRAYLKLAVDAGSVLETDDERGLAHFVEHMAFNGTERFPKSALVEYLRSLGMRFGPEVNAYTSFDETVYGIEVPTDTADGARTVPDRALAVIDDWTRALRFAPEDVDSERAVILEEWRMGLGANDRVRRALLPTLFSGSPYAERLPIGLPEIVRTAPAERLAAFYKKWYRPDNMALVFVGDFDAAALEASLAAHFAGPSASGALVRPRYELPPPADGRLAVAVATDPELSYGFAQLGWKRVPKAVDATIAGYSEGLYEELVDRMLGLRFLDRTVLPETPYTGAGSSYARYGRTARFFMLSAMAEKGSVARTLRSLLREKELVVRYGFSDAELAEAKKSILSDLDAAVAEKGRNQSEALAGELVRHYLGGAPVPDPEWEAAAAREALSGADKKRVDAFARSLFASNDLTVMLAAPEDEKATLPDEAGVRALIREAAAEKLAPPAPAAKNVSADGLLSGRPVPRAVVSETRDGKRGITVWELPNGARVIVKPTENKNDQIVLAAVARGGKTSVPDADAVTAALASGMAERSGVGPYALPDLVRRLNGKQVELSYSVGDYTRGFRGSSTVADLETFFQLLRLSLTEPRVDEGAAESYLERVRTLYAQRSANPESVFSDRIAEVVSGGNPRFAPLTADKVGEASVEAARRILKEQLAVGDFTFAFAGNVEPDRLRPLVETYLASIPGARSGRDWVDAGMRRPDSADVTVRKGKDKKGAVFMARYLPSPNAERPAMVSEGLSELLDIVLVREIREKLGGVYSIGAYAYQSAGPASELGLVVQFSCDPDRAEALSAAVDGQLAAIAAGNIADGDFAKVVLALKKGREQSLQDNSFIAAVLANLDEVHRRPLDRLYGYGESYDSLTAKDLSAMAAEFMARGRIRATLLPEGN